MNQVEGTAPPVDSPDSEPARSGIETPKVTGHYDVVFVRGPCTTICDRQDTDNNSARRRNRICREEFVCLSSPAFSFR